MKQRISISPVPTGGVHLCSHGSTLFFDKEGWDELSNMVSTFNKLGFHIQNYEDLPTRTPIHANTPQATLDDLV